MDEHSEREIQCVSQTTDTRKTDPLNRGKRNHNIVLHCASDCCGNELPQDGVNHEKVIELRLEHWNAFIRECRFYKNPFSMLRQQKLLAVTDRNCSNQWSILYKN